jgi:hypothetical protein
MIFRYSNEGTDFEEGTHQICAKHRFHANEQAPSVWVVGFSYSNVAC